MKFRHLPTIVEAVQWNKPGDHPAVRRPAGSHELTYGVINTCRGIFSVEPGDWIVEDARGEFYPVRAVDFGVRYAPEAVVECPVVECPVDVFA